MKRSPRWWIRLEPVLFRFPLWAWYVDWRAPRRHARWAAIDRNPRYWRAPEPYAHYDDPIMLAMLLQRIGRWDPDDLDYVTRQVTLEVVDVDVIDQALDIAESWVGHDPPRPDHPSFRDWHAARAVDVLTEARDRWKIVDELA